jgi:hypothetical protein
MHLAIFLENFLLFLHFLIQIWKHVKFYTNSVFCLNDRELVEPVRYTGQTGRYTSQTRWYCVVWIQIWIRLVSGRFPAEPDQKTGTGPRRFSPVGLDKRPHQDRLLDGPLGLLDLCYTAPVGVERKDYRGIVLGLEATHVRIHVKYS